MKNWFLSHFPSFRTMVTKGNLHICWYEQKMRACKCWINRCKNTKTVCFWLDSSNMNPSINKRSRGGCKHWWLHASDKKTHENATMLSRGRQHKWTNPFNFDTNRGEKKNWETWHIDSLHRIYHRIDVGQFGFYNNVIDIWNGQENDHLDLFCCSSSGSAHKKPPHIFNGDCICLENECVNDIISYQSDIIWMPWFLSTLEKIHWMCLYVCVLDFIYHSMFNCIHSVDYKCFWVVLKRLNSIVQTRKKNEHTFCFKTYNHTYTQ